MRVLIFFFFYLFLLIVKDVENRYIARHTNYVLYHNKRRPQRQKRRETKNNTSSSSSNQWNTQWSKVNQQPPTLVECVSEVTRRFMNTYRTQSVWTNLFLWFVLYVVLFLLFSFPSFLIASSLFCQVAATNRYTTIKTYQMWSWLDVIHVAIATVRSFLLSFRVFFWRFFRSNVLTFSNLVTICSSSQIWQKNNDEHNKILPPIKFTKFFCLFKFRLRYSNPISHTNK